MPLFLKGAEIAFDRNEEGGKGKRGRWAWRSEEGNIVRALNSTKSDLAGLMSEEEKEPPPSSRRGEENAVRVGKMTESRCRAGSLLVRKERSFHDP